MSTSGDPTYSVWTYRNESDETDDSTGAPDRLLVDNLTEAHARETGAALSAWQPTASIEVRSAIGDAVTAYGPARHGLTVADIPIPKGYVPRPRRRLGMRGNP